MNSLKITEVLENFPFRAIRDRQRKVIEDTCNALNSGCKHIILEAPHRIWKKCCRYFACKNLRNQLRLYCYKGFTVSICKRFPFLKGCQGQKQLSLPCKRILLELINTDADVVRQVRLVNATTSLVIMVRAYMTRLWKDLIVSTGHF